MVGGRTAVEARESVMNWAAKRAQRLASVRALLDGGGVNAPAPTPVRALHVGTAAPVCRPPPPPPTVQARRAPSLANQAPIHADELSIDAALYRKRPAGVPLDLWLEMLAEEA